MKTTNNQYNLLKINEIEKIDKKTFEKSVAQNKAWLKANLTEFQLEEPLNQIDEYLSLGIEFINLKDKIKEIKQI